MVTYISIDIVQEYVHIYLYILYMDTYINLEYNCIMVDCVSIPFCKGGSNVSASDAQKRASSNYIKNKLDEIKVRVPKGDKAKIQAHADKHDGGSVNGFIKRAINETMERDGAERKTDGNID